MSNSPRYVGFIDPPYNVTLTDDTGAALNLTGCTSNSFTLTMINQGTGLALAGAGVWTVTNATAGQASYQYTLADLATAGIWMHYVTVKLPAEPGVREFDPDLVQILPGTVGAGAAPPGVLPAPAAAPLFFNVRDYGAAGDGVTDDSTPINNAIAAAITAGGGTVFFPRGTYNHASDILVNGNNISLVGTGRASILLTAASSNANGIKANGNHIVISDLQINGNKSNTQQPGVGTQYIHLNGIYITGSDDVTVTRCYIQNFYEGGVLADSSTNLIISQNEIANGNDNGVFLRPSPGNVSCSQASVTNNIAHNMGYSGIQGVRCSYLTFANNVCYSNGPSTAQGDGCGFEGCSYSVIANNVCYSNGIQGINVRHTAEGGTNIVSSHIVIANNVCYNHTSTNGDAGGLVISETDDSIVTGNVCYGNRWGINLNDGATSLGLTHCKIANNVVRGNSSNGINIQATGTKDILITENFVAENGSDGLYSTATVFILAGIFKGNTGEGIHFASSTQNASNSLVNQALVYDNTDNGILIDSGVANVEVRNCWANNIVGTNQGRFLYESSGGGPTRLSGNRIINQSNQPYFFNNAASRYYDEQTTGLFTVTTSTYTVASNDEAILCNRAGAITVTIPNPANMSGRMLIIKDASGAANTNNITITPSSGTIDGASNKVINTAYGVVRLTNNGTNWFTI